MTQKEWTPEKCWQELEPSFSEIVRLIATAPLPPNERAGLSLLLLTASIACAGAEAKDWRGTGSLESHAKEMTDLALAAAFPHKKPDLAIVSPPEPTGEMKP